MTAVAAAPADSAAPPTGRRARSARLAVLAAVAVCAACGLVYELALVATGSYLVGSSITQTSLVIGVTMASMGIGALVAKRLIARPAAGFVAVELVLGTVGAFSVPALYTAFAWLDVHTPALLLASILIGTLIGAEIPLLMALIGRLGDADPALVVADMSAADYAGALIGGLAFPFLLLPALGLLQGTLAVGAVNIAAGAATGLWLLPRHRRAVAAAALLAAALVALMWVKTGDFQLTAQQRLFRDPVVHAEDSAYQSIVVTEADTPEGPDTRLFLDGDLQFSTLDEHRYHEALVLPAMAGPHRRVLVLGGGDGLAARRILDHPGVEAVTLVDLDPAVVRAASTVPRIVQANGGVFGDPRLDVVHADAFTWVRDSRERFDVIVVDLPDPDTVDLAKLYSTEFYGMAADLLAPGGRVVVQAGSPYFVPEQFWTIAATVEAAGLRTVPYHVDVPSFGDWGFVLAAVDRTPDLAVPDEAPAPRFLTDAVLAAARVFPPDRLPAEGAVRASTLLEPTVLEAARGGWAGY